MTNELSVYLNRYIENELGDLFKAKDLSITDDIPGRNTRIVIRGVVKDSSKIVAIEKRISDLMMNTAPDRFEMFTEVIKMMVYELRDHIYNEWKKEDTTQASAVGSVL